MVRFNFYRLGRPSPDSILDVQEAIERVYRNSVSFMLRARPFPDPVLGILEKTKAIVERECKNDCKQMQFWP